MTVASDIDRSGPYSGNGVTTEFDYDFRIINEDHLTVILTDASGVETVLVKTSDYTVTGVDQEEGGSILLTVAPATGKLLTILRNVPFTQLIDLENQGPYFAETVERGFDLSAMRDQQLSERLDRAVVIPASADASALDRMVGDIIRLGDSADNIDTVADNIGSVDTVAGSIANVNTVANNIAGVNDVAEIKDQVVTVAGIAGNVNTVAGDSDEINALAAITAAVNTVASIAPAVSTVAANDEDISFVAANIADVTNFADVYQGPRTTDPTTRHDGSALMAGDLYFNTSTDLMRVYTSLGWRDAAAQSLNMVTDSFVGDGTKKGFDLSTAPGVAENVLVWVGGVRQVPADDYTVADATLTLLAAPGAGVDIDTLIVATVSELYVPAAGSVEESSLSLSLVNAMSSVVVSRAALKALDTSRHKLAYLSELGREGVFNWRAGNYAAIVAVDTLEGAYIKADAVATTAGAWVRQHSNTFDIRWFGAKMDGGTDDSVPIQAAINLAGTTTGSSGGPRAAVFAPSGFTIRQDAQVNITVPIKVDFRSYIVTALTSGFLYAINPLAISAAGNSGYDLYFEGLVGPGAAFPASRNNAGLSAFIIRSMVFSKMEVRYLSGFTCDAILCDGTGGTYTGGQQQSILHNTFNLGVVANNGYGFYSLSLHAATHQFQGNRVNIQNCLQNFMGIVDGAAGFTASTSNTYDINALDNATSVCIDTYCPFNTWYVGFTGAPGTSLRMNGNDCDYNEFVFSNNLTTDIVINNNGGGIRNVIRCKSPSSLPGSQGIVNGTDYTNSYGCPISVTVPMTGTGTYQMVITNPQGVAYAISAVASGGYATFPTLHHGWKWKVFTISGSVTYGEALVLAA